MKPIMRTTEHVNLAMFRERTDYLLDLVRRDLPACVDEEERAKCFPRIRAAMSDLAHTRCNRAKERDENRCVTALEMARVVLAEASS